MRRDTDRPSPGKKAADTRIDELKDIDERISKIAEDDPLGALFVVKNLSTEAGLDEKPLIGKIILQLAEKLDVAIRHQYTEKAKVYKSLLLKLVEELDVKDIYSRVILATGKTDEDEETDELLEDTSIEESVSFFRKS